MADTDTKIAPAPAAKTKDEDANVGAGGMSLGSQTEIGGGHITKELVNDPEDAESTDPLRWHRRYMASRLAKDAGNIIGRAPDAIGLWGEGDVFHGSGILVDIDSLAKVRVTDGYVFKGHAVYANSRDLPHALVNGDVAKNLAGGKD